MSNKVNDIKEAYLKQSAKALEDGKELFRLKLAILSEEFGNSLKFGFHLLHHVLSVSKLFTRHHNE